MERFLIRSQDLLQGIPFEVLDNQIGEGYDAVVLSVDAQATIAAHEETILKMGENAAVVAKDAMAAKEQVAALQAERDTARRRVDELEAREVDVVLLREDLEKRTAELEAAKAELEQERVRLASCLIAAEGGTKDIVNDRMQDFLDSVFVYCLVFLKAIWIAVIGTLLLPLVLSGLCSWYVSFERSLSGMHLV